MTWLQQFQDIYALIVPVFNTITYVLNIIGTFMTLGADFVSNFLSLF
ncbi:MAG: hypothetical protein K1Y02_25255 [Candidatus Hydrogenedentes bacterium]|nr:hypothetical protein [Candidatus Hydrogenedentota bacterium]